MKATDMQREWPAIIQGGMGIGVSNYRLARTVAESGCLGVVSGTAVDTVFVRRLQLGDANGDMRRALSHFPWPPVVERVLGEFFIEGGKLAGSAFRLLSLPAAEMSRARLEVLVLANFAEVWLAKEGGGVIGINYLEKIQTPTLASLFGALLAGVDVVLMGAGIPSSIPGVIARLARWEDAELRLSVEDNQQDEPVQMRFSPRELFGLPALPLRQPQFLAIVSSHVIAKALQKKANGPVDGFVIEDYTAGGHNAPPRKARRGEAVFASGFSSADVPDLAEFRALGVPFWLAGSCATPERLRAARAAGAAGVQIGTPFAFCDESAILPELKRDVVERAKRRRLSVVTDFEASPTGYPFKRIVREEQAEEIAALRARARVCDLGYLRRPYHDAAGRLGYRCAGEPVQTYLHKGGDEADTANKLCLCNQLLATIGLAQERDTGVELPLLTAGEELSEIARFVGPLQSSYTAGDVIRFMQGRAPAA